MTVMDGSETQPFLCLLCVSLQEGMGLVTCDFKSLPLVVFVLITSKVPRGHVNPQLGPVPVLSGASAGSYGWARIQLLCIAKGPMHPRRLEGLGPVEQADVSSLF